MKRIWQSRTQDRLRRALAVHGAARLGETAVVSHFVHMTNPYDPGRVRVMGHADAGRVFYGRMRRQEVVHLDVFHEVGEVDHRRLSRALLAAASPFVSGAADDGLGMLDQIDVQTATGGGRITGDLVYGDRESLRRAHANHVHIALRTAPNMYILLLELVCAAEDEIIAQGLEIRRVEGVVIERGRGGPPADLSPYTGPSDSVLKETGRPDTSGPGGGETDPGDLHVDPIPGGEEQEPSPPLYSEPLLDAIDLSGDVGGLEELRGTLERVRSGCPPDRSRPDVGLSGWDRQNLTDALKARGLVVGDGQGHKLTARGEELRKFLGEYREEVLRIMRRLARKSPRLHLRPERSAVAQPSLPGRRGRRTRLVGDALSPGADEIAIAETVTEACRSRGRPSPIRPRDLRYHLRRQTTQQDICLVIDASASMAGKRLRAARHLAHHLVLATKDRVAVIVFQERTTRVICPFTRDRRLLERSISRMQAYGLTPLAGALADTVSFIRSTRSHRPLVLMITDGVPTIPRWSLNPLIDAVQAAGEIGRRRLPFACIGLEPNRTFLERLASAGGGHLYIVDELDRDVLVAIARRERNQQLRPSPGTG